MTRGKIGFNNTKSGAGEQFLLVDAGERLLQKECAFHRHRWDQRTVTTATGSNHCNWNHNLYSDSGEVRSIVVNQLQHIGGGYY